MYKKLSVVVFVVEIVTLATVILSSANGLSTSASKLKSGCQEPEAPKFGISELDYDEESIEYFCQPGYSLVGSARSHCNSTTDGTWSNPPPTCVGTDCERPTLKGGTVISEHGGGLVRFQCRKGYELKGSEVLICTDGQWNASTAVCIRKHKKVLDVISKFHGKEIGKKTHEDWLSESDYSCVSDDRNVFPPTVPNARTFTQWAMHDGRPRLYATYQCKWGYATAGGPKILYCQKEEWIGSVPKCQTVVKEDEMVQGDSSQGGSSPLTHDQLLRYADYTCVGKDSDSSVDAPTISNGKQTLRFTILDGLPHLYTKYLCEKGFTLAEEDKAYMYCKNQAWIGVLPKCVPVPVKHTCLIDNGGCPQICSDDDVIGSSCSCKEGFSLASDNNTCDDIDECEVNYGGCGHICDNTDGSYVCSCYPNYQLLSDGKKCEHIPEIEEN